MNISSIKGREIFDSNGKPTVEVELKTEVGEFKSSVPSGVSTGRYEAVELPASTAVENIEKIIAPVLIKQDLSGQQELDKLLIELDGTENKSRLGANAILAVSIASCRALAVADKLPLWHYINKVCGGRASAKLPRPSFNMIEGGKHADSGLAFQEFMIVPQRDSFQENLETGLKVYQKLGEIIGKNVRLSREGAFSPRLKSAFEAIDLILEASQGENIKIAIDAAGARGENYQELIAKYPIMSIEDPFEEDDFAAWSSFKPDILVFGDDLTVTNLERMEMAKEKNLCNALILKPNQIGTVSEALEAARLAQSYGWKIMAANRAGETTDDFIADLAVGIGAEFIKSGAPFPKERMAKYERLAGIEKEFQVRYHKA